MTNPGAFAWFYINGLSHQTSYLWLHRKYHQTLHHRLDWLQQQLTTQATDAKSPGSVETAIHPNVKKETASNRLWKSFFFLYSSIKSNVSTPIWSLYQQTIPSSWGLWHNAFINPVSYLHSRSHWLTLNLKETLTRSYQVQGLYSCITRFMGKLSDNPCNCGH